MEHPFARDMLSDGEVEHILDTAAQLADWVVIDAPPVALAPDALPFAKLADHVLLVVRPDHTRLQDLA